MRLVLDTNVFLSALLRRSFTRAALVHPRLELIMPEFALAEIARHFPAIAERMGVPADAARLTLELLLGNVRTVPLTEYASHMRSAEDLVRDVDPDDAPFVALSLASACPIWTQDKALLDAKDIRTVSTQEVVRLLGEA